MSSSCNIFLKVWENKSFRINIHCSLLHYISISLRFDWNILNGCKKNIIYQKISLYASIYIYIYICKILDVIVLSILILSEGNNKLHRQMRAKGKGFYLMRITCNWWAHTHTHKYNIYIYILYYIYTYIWIYLYIYICIEIYIANIIIYRIYIFMQGLISVVIYTKHQFYFVKLKISIQIIWEFENKIVSNELLMQLLIVNIIFENGQRK